MATIVVALDNETEGAESLKVNWYSLIIVLVSSSII